MTLERFYSEKLEQATYLIGCGATGEAVVVDANGDVDRYIRAAESQGLRITHITETYIHADFVFGSRELAFPPGAQIYLSGEGDKDWMYGTVPQITATELAEQLHTAEVAVLDVPGRAEWGAVRGPPSPPAYFDQKAFRT